MSTATLEEELIKPSEERKNEPLQCFRCGHQCDYSEGLLNEDNTLSCPQCGAKNTLEEV